MLSRIMRMVVFHHPPHRELLRLVESITRQNYHNPPCDMQGAARVAPGLGLGRRLSLHPRRPLREDGRFYWNVYILYELYESCGDTS